MSDLQHAWTELVDELRTRAPVSARMIRPSLNEAGRVFRELELDETHDLGAWFGLHDGAGDDMSGGQLLGDNVILGTAQSIRTTLAIREIWAEQVPGETENTSGNVETAGEVVGTWLDRYVMIGSDTMGGGWFVDLRPGPLHGCVRYWDEVGADDVNAEVWPSLAQLLRAVTGALRTGTPVDGYIVNVVNGALHWDDAE